MQKQEYSYGNQNEQEHQALVLKSESSEIIKESRIPRATYFILGMELCERLCYYGATLVFQLYCLTMLGLSNPDTDSIISAFQFWAYLTPLLGGYLADSYWGKYKTILIFGAVYLFGMIALTLSATPFIWQKYPFEEGIAGFVCFGVALFFVGFGTGGIKSNVSTMIADQLDNSKSEDVEKVYRWFYWSINIGSVVGIAATPSLHELTSKIQDGQSVGTSYWLSFLVPTIFFFLALVIFFSARNIYIVKKPEGSLLSRFFGVLKSAWKNRNADQYKISNVPFVLKADPTKFDPEFIAQVQQVLNVCKVFTLFPVYWLLYNQMSSNFITQAQWMSRPSWLNEEQLNLVDPLVIIFMIPVVNFILPIIRRRFGLKLGSLTRIATGFVIAAFGFLYVGFLQLDIQRRGTWVGPDSEYILKSGVSEEITIWYQTVPYFFIGVSEIFSAISALEFAYSKAPSNMKAIVMALFLLSNAFGSILGLILAPIFVPKNFTFIFFAFSGGMLLLALIFFWKFKDSDYEKVEAPSHQVFTVAFSDKELES